ncbi:MAG: YegS/Rv2252/BmrU family lipid kinase [Clostridia bacterium]|nr:YegS/Rv2252/BmrU family lipid kinase [Clostridia bacterium]
MAYIHTLDAACRVLLIMNPVSGMYQSKSLMYDVVSVFTKAGCVTTTLMTTAPGDASSYVVEHAEKHDIVVCLGGDGTLNETISGMMRLERERRIPIGFLPAGTTNDVARALHVPIGNAKKAAKQILSADNIHHDVGLFQGDQNRSQYFTYIASFGAFTKVSYQTPRWKKHLFGRMAYLMDGVQALGDIRPWNIRISCGQRDFSEDGPYAFGCVSNSTSIAGLVKLDQSRVSFNDGKFEVMLIRHPKTAMELELIIRSLVNQSFNVPMEGKPPMVRLFRTSCITFRPEDEMPWTVDGEYGGAPREVVIKNCHGAVEILRRIS